jgi:periplasmic protein TonB
MFEDSTFESTGRIRTRSRNWMVAAFIFNGAILLALILIPLIYPEALPRLEMPWLMTAPPPPPSAPPTQPHQQAQPTRGMTEMPGGKIQAPILFPREPFISKDPEPAGPTDVAELGPGPGGPGGPGGVFPGQPAPPVIRLVQNAPVRLSGKVVEGLLINKVIPRYPPMAIATRTEGTVVLQATISKAGTIENLRAIGGPPMLQQAALDAVKAWRYRPYLLGGEPVEVETTVNVVFNLGR